MSSYMGLSLEQNQHRLQVAMELPKLCGAIDGKHIANRSPPNPGSLYYNYKNNFSIVLMVAVDAGYRFIVVDVGNYDSNSDTGIFKHSHFGQKFLLNELGLLT